MFKGKKVVVVMPAYNAARTLRKTYDEVLEQDVVDDIIVVDDASQDATVTIARALPAAKLRVHGANKGYGANQKTKSPSKSAQTSSSWSIPITSTRPS